MISCYRKKDLKRRFFKKSIKYQSRYLGQAGELRNGTAGGVAAGLNVEGLEAADDAVVGATNTLVEANEAVCHGPCGRGVGTSVEALNLAQDALATAVAGACRGHADSLAKAAHDKRTGGKGTRHAGGRDGRASGIKCVNTDLDGGDVDEEGRTLSCGSKTSGGHFFYT